MFLAEQDGNSHKCNPHGIDDEIHLALDYSRDLVSKHTEQGVFLYASPSAEVLLGYLEDEIIGKSIYQFCHPEDMEAVMKRFSGHSDTYEPIRFRLRKKDSDYIWMETNCSKLGESGNSLCISRDITAQKIMEDEIMETREQYRLLVEQSKDTIGMMTERGIWTYINSEGKKLFGFASAKEIIGTSLFEYISVHDYPILSNCLKEKKRSPFEMNIIRCDGEMRHTEISLIPMNFKGRNRFQIIIRDITGQKMAEERLENAEKLSMFGQMAAVIVHEIRNPLTAIKGFTQILSEGKPNEYTGIILGEIDRLEGIVNDLLLLAKPQARKLETANLAAICNSVVLLLTPQADKSLINLHENYEYPEALILCDEGKIKQVLINIIKNAMESMPGGGTISIDLKVDNDFVRLCIEDEGQGIPDEVLRKIGEPFFSTKEDGTGLGLMICKKIIKTHGGTLDIESEENAGTKVTLHLPLKKQNEKSPDGL